MICERVFVIKLRLFKSEEATLEWLLVQKDPTNEAIRDQEGDELQKTIERTESVAVFVCE